MSGLPTFPTSISTYVLSSLRVCMTSEWLLLSQISPLKVPLRIQFLLGWSTTCQYMIPMVMTKKTATPRQAIAPFQVSFISFNPVSHVTSGMGLGFLFRAWGMLFLSFCFLFFISKESHGEREKAAEIFARQRSPLLHHVIMFAVRLTGQTKPALSIRAVYSDGFFVLRNCASNGDLSCEESCEVEKRKAKSAQTNGYEWITDLPHSASVLKVGLESALAAVSSGAAPGRVWQQCLRIAPKTLSCLPCTF